MRFARADLVASPHRRTRRGSLAATGVFVWMILQSGTSYAGPTGREIDATTLHHKVLCGYQGWFRCPGDAADRGWRHWSRNPATIDLETLTVEMWPDMTELAAAEQYPAPGFRGPDGKAATLFSSDDRRTVDRHFQWMQ